MTVSPRRIAYLAQSADGFIADRHGQVGWLESFGTAEDFGFADFLANIDALAMGRRAFDHVTGFGGAWPYGARPTLVLTHRPLPPHAPASARGAGEDDVTQALLGAPGRIWIVGGGQMLAFCLRRGLVDALELFTMPILLGEGASLSGRLHKSMKLSLARTETLAHGVIKTQYLIKAGDAVAETDAAAKAGNAAGAPALLQSLATRAEEGLSTGPRAGAASPKTDPGAPWPYPPEANTEKDA